MTTISQVQGWIYPGSTAVNGQSDVPTEYSSGRQIYSLKPQYYSLQSNGTLVQNTVNSDGWDGYTASNAAGVKQWSVTQFVTISGTAPGIGTLAGSVSLQTSFNNTLVSFLQSSGLTGIELDFEEPPWTTAKFNDMKTIAASLGTALHANGFKLMITGPALYGTAAWDWSAFNSLPVDFCCFMAYDHMYDSGTIGDPLCPFTWLTDCCNWMVSQVSGPTIVAGLPAYGYFGTSGASINNLGSGGVFLTNNETYVQMSVRAGFSTAARDTNSGELIWTNSGNVNVICDSISVNQKIAYVEAAGITTISIWSLGGNNQWPTVQLVPPVSTPTLNGSVIASDTFGNRTVVTGLTFGTASGGDTWNTLAAGGGTATQLSINEKQGLAWYDNSGSGSGYAEVVQSSVQGPDGEVLCRFSALSSAAGHFGLFTRYTANSHWYRCDINIGSNSVSLAKTVAGVFTSNLASASVTVNSYGSYYWCRFRTQGNTVEAKVWADGTAEPGGWTVTVTDTSLTTTAGQVGMMLVPVSTAPGGGIAVDSFTAVSLSNTSTLTATLAGVGTLTATLSVGLISGAIYTVSNGQTIQAQDLNQVISILQQNSGGQEIGDYYLEASSFTTGGLISWYYPTLSRGTTPVSLTVDTTTQAFISMTGTGSNPSVGHLTYAGFQLYGFSTAAFGNCRCGGKYTVQY